MLFASKTIAIKAPMFGAFFKTIKNYPMEIENKLNADILKVTMTIRNEYPELSKYLNEMSVTLPDVSSPEIDRKVMLDYYNSLTTMLKEYKPSH